LSHSVVCTAFRFLQYDRENLNRMKSQMEDFKIEWSNFYITSVAANYRFFNVIHCRNLHLTYLLTQLLIIAANLLILVKCRDSQHSTQPLKKNSKTISHRQLGLLRGEG